MCGSFGPWMNKHILTIFINNLKFFEMLLYIQFAPLINSVPNFRPKPGIQWTHIGVGFVVHLGPICFS